MANYRRPAEHSDGITGQHAVCAGFFPFSRLTGAVPALSGVVGQMLTYTGGWRLAMRRAVQDLGVGGDVWPQENLNSL